MIEHMVMDKMHARARWVSYTNPMNLQDGFLSFHSNGTDCELQPIGDRVQLWRDNRQRGDPEKADCVWERWNEIV